MLSAVMSTALAVGAVDLVLAPAQGPGARPSPRGRSLRPTRRGRSRSSRQVGGLVDPLPAAALAPLVVGDGCRRPGAVTCRRRTSGPRGEGLPEIVSARRRAHMTSSSSVDVEGAVTHEDLSRRVVPDASGPVNQLPIAPTARTTQSIAIGRGFAPLTGPSSPGATRTTSPWTTTINPHRRKSTP